MLFSWLALVVALLLIGLIIFLIVRQVKEHHQQQDPMLHRLREHLSRLHPDIPHVKMYRGDRSYTINKHKIYLCLYDENGNYYPFNHLVYVFLHEYSHYLNKTDVGHTEEFHRIFDELLEEAAQMGLYNPSIPIVQNYCQH